MNNRGISGFSVVFLILVLIGFIYIGYSIGSVWFRAQSLKEKVKEVIKLNPLGADANLINRIILEAKDAGVDLSGENIYIDRSIPDSVMAVVEYPDSSVLPIFTYRKIQHIEVIVVAHAE